MADATPVVDRLPYYLTNFIWLPQYDGQGYHVTANDRGKGTNLGVTQATWDDWIKKNPHVTPPLPSLQRATQADFIPLIRQNYWLAVGAQLLPAGVDLQVFDLGYTSGAHTSALLLQRLLRMNVIDGWVGPNTAKAAASWNPSELIDALSLAHLTFYKSIPEPGGWKTFGNGWSNRNTARTTLARKVAGLLPGAPPAVTKSAPVPSPKPVQVDDSAETASLNDTQLAKVKSS